VNGGGNFSLRLTSFQEKDPNFDIVQQALMEGLQFSRICKSEKTADNFVQSVEFHGRFSNNATATFSLAVFSNASEIVFDGNTFPLEPGSIKVGFTISDWPWKSVANTFYMTVIVESSEYVSYFNASKIPGYVSTFLGTVGNSTLRTGWLRSVLLDGHTVQPVDVHNQLDPYDFYFQVLKKGKFICGNVPYFHNITYDPGIVFLLGHN
jgi:hypothetical protein